MKRPFAVAFAFTFVGVARLLADQFVTTDFRTVTNKTTGQRSIALCGPNGSGVFVNSTDNGGVSCIDEHGPIQQGPLVWIHMNSSIYVESGCAIQAHDNCGLLPGNTTGQCSVARPYQAFRTTDLVYMGESDSFGGSLTFPKMKDFVCPTPTLTSTVAVSPATRTPTPTVTRTPTSTPPIAPSTTPASSTPTPTATPFYVCVTATPIPTPPPTAIPSKTPSPSSNRKG